MQNLASLVAEPITCLLDIPIISITRSVSRPESIFVFTHHIQHLRIDTQKLLSFSSGEELADRCGRISMFQVTALLGDAAFQT